MTNSSVTNNENKKDTKKNALNNISVLEPALIIAIITFILFLIGHAYTNAYLNRLGFNIFDLDFPVTFYMSRSETPLIIGLIFIIISLVSSYKYQKNTLRAFLSNIFLLLPIITYIYYLVDLKLGLLYYFTIIISVISILGYLIFSIAKISLMTPFWKASNYKKLVVMLSLILALYPLASTLGAVRARLCGEGKLNYGKKIEFVLNISESTEIEDKYMILVLHYGNIFYAVEKQVPLPPHPTLYLIPESRCQYVTISNIN